MLIEKLRDEFIHGKPKLSTLKSIYNNYKNSDLDYLTLIFNPEKSRLVKIPYNFYLPSKVVRQETVINLKSDDKGHCIHSIDMENEHIKSDHFLMHRIVASSMVINPPNIGITYICSSLNKMCENIQNHWCSKKKSNKNEIRLIYIPNEESLNFKNTGFEYNNCIHFNFHVITTPNSLINIKLTRVIEFIPKKEYLKYHYESSDNSSTDELLPKIPVRNYDKNYKTPLLVLINSLLEEKNKNKEEKPEEIRNSKEIGNYSELEIEFNPDLPQNFADMNLANDQTYNDDIELEPIEFKIEDTEEEEKQDIKPTNKEADTVIKNKTLFDMEYQLNQMRKIQQKTFDYNNFRPLYLDLKSLGLFEKVSSPDNINQIELEEKIINNLNKEVKNKDDLWIYDKYYIIKRLNTKIFNETNETKLKLLDAANKLISNSPEMIDILMNIKPGYNETWVNFNNYLNDLGKIKEQNPKEFDMYFNIDNELNIYLIPYINSITEVYKRTHDRLKYDKKSIESEPLSSYKSIIIAAAIAASIIAPELIPEELGLLNSWGLLKYSI